MMIFFLEMIDFVLVVMMCFTIRRFDANLRMLISKLLDFVQTNKGRIDVVVDEIKEMKKNIKDFNRKLDELEDELK